MHCIKEIQIKNFRSCYELELYLSDFTALVGYNNAGKSNILDSIKWLLKSSVLVEKDFFDPNHPIIVTGKITGITSEILDNLIARHRDRISPYCVDETIYIRRRQASPGGSVRDIILEVKNPVEENPGNQMRWDVNPNGIDAAIKAIFPDPIEIGAMENATEDIGKSKSGTTINKLINEIISPIEHEHGATIQEALEGIRRKLDAEGIERAQELNDFDANANEKLRDIFPGIQIRLHIPTPEIKDIFKSGTIKILESGVDVCRDIQSLGHGAQRSIQMALVRYLADIKSTNNANPARTLLLIDEPELYLHPQAIENVRLALKKLSTEGYQVLFSTHSPSMIDAADIGTTLVVRKNDDNQTFTRQRLRDAINKIVDDAQSQVQTLFELSNSSQILFSDKVLIAEGRTERRLLPEIYYQIRGSTLSADRTALVSPGGSGNSIKCLRILDGMGIPAKAVVDLDFAFKDAVRGNLLEQDDPDINACRDIFPRLAQENDIYLAEDGFPRKGGSIKPAHAYAILAREEEAIPYIENLHNKLLTSNIWLWRKGAIEQYLGIEGKNEKIWATYKKQLHENGFEETLVDYRGVIELFQWLNA